MPTTNQLTDNAKLYMVPCQKNNVTNRDYMAISMWQIQCVYCGLMFIKLLIVIVNVDFYYGFL
jgi:hypothetical protein